VPNWNKFLFEEEKLQYYSAIVSEDLQPNLTRPEED
jgi:hypothetical protein